MSTTHKRAANISYALALVLTVFGLVITWNDPIAFGIVRPILVTITMATFIWAWKANGYSLHG